MEIVNIANDVNQKTETIIGLAYEVMNELGCGFLEVVYHQSSIINHSFNTKGL